WNEFGMHHFEIVHIQEVLDAMEAVIAEVLVINRVELQSLQETEQVMRFRNEHAFIGEHTKNAVDNLMDIFDVRKDIRSRDNGGRTQCLSDVSGDIWSKESNRRWNPPRIRDLPHVRRFDAHDAVPRIMKIAEQRTVIRTNIHNQILGT